MLLSSTRKDETFSEFLDFLDSIRNQRACVLIGHNARVFDSSILLRQLSTCELVLSRAMNTPMYFADSLPFIRKEPGLSKSKALGAIFQEVTGNSFNAHDALGDSNALQEIMLDGRLGECLAATKSNAVHITEV